jgi:hypothetical protein
MHQRKSLKRKKKSKKAMPCVGVAWYSSEQVVELEPLDQPSRRAAQEQFCRKLTSLKAKTPTGKRMVIGVSNSNK